MSLAAWGRWDDEVDAITLAALQRGYVRRQRWLARVAAVEVVSALGEAMGGPSTGSGRGGQGGVSASGRRYRETSVDGLMAEMGARWG